MRCAFLFLGVLTTSIFTFKSTFSQPIFPDTVHVLAIRVEFQQDDATTTTGNGKFDLSQSTDPFQIDPPPHNRLYFQDHLQFVSNYFKKISRQMLFIMGDVFPIQQDTAYQLDAPMTSYNPNTTPRENNEGLARLFRDAIMKADEDAAIDFSKYQSFVVFHAGVGKDVDLGFDETPQDIPSLFLTQDFLLENLGVMAITVDNGTVEVSNGMILPETESQEGIELGLNGILTSNFGSQLGWLDLFSPETRRSGIGRFGLMDAGLFNGDGLLPALPCAWTRIEAGWEEPVNIYYSSNDEVTIYSTLTENPNRVFRVPINEKEYFLIENRFASKLSFDSLQFVIGQQQNELPTAREILQTYYSTQVTFSPRGVLIDIENPDIGLPGTGCLIWHIDENIIDQNRHANSVNANPEHRGVDIEEADGSQDIGQDYSILSAGSGSEIGWVLDMWYQGNNAPVFKNEFSQSSIPNSRSYYNRANSHIKIFNFSPPDSVMTFQVELNIFQQNFPVFVDPLVYGRVISIKTTDLNLDGAGDIILTTEQGKILAVNQSGRSVWGTDSFLVADIDGQILLPPVLFDDPTTPGGSSKGMVVLTRNGKAFGFKFNGQSLDTLFTPLNLSTQFTTYPIASYPQDQMADVVWGAENGRVYRLTLSPGGVTIDSLSSVNESIKYVHLNDNGDITVLTISGKVYRNGEFIKNSELPYFSPVGLQAAGLTNDGKFLHFEGTSKIYAEEGIFRFDSPMIANPFQWFDAVKPFYFVAGDNRLYSFNYNFSLVDNFPVKIYNPDENKSLTISPLFNNFFTESLTEEPGVLVSDPAGLIDGYNLKGKRLADFPLALGDSLQATPLLLDINGNGNIELAAITGNGMLYVWDLQSEYLPFGWNQLFFDELNSNRIPKSVTPLPLHPFLPDPGSALLPGDRVYNWPNPNIENYTFIRYYLTQRAEVKIKIYDLAGDFVEDFSGPGEPQTANEVRWNLQNVQSGVYLARIEANSGQKSEVKIIKIAVVK